MKKIFLALLLLCSNAFAAITDGKFGINQIFDVQYNWNGSTLNASNFIAPYNKNFQTVTATTGQYFQFFASTTNPGTYGLKLMNSNGTQHSIVHDTGDITALGSGAIFYIGSGFFGNVISTAQGYSYGSSASFTNMDTSVTSSDLNNYTYASSTPLASGQTAAPAAPAYGVNFTRLTSYDWASYTAGSQPVSSEQAHEAFDNDNNSKWFGLRSQGVWVVSRLSATSKAVQKIQFVTASDAAERDPTGYRIWGSTDGYNWVLIKEEAITMPSGRLAASTVYTLGNVTSYLYYKVEFTGARNNGDAVQVAEIRLLYDVDDPKGIQGGGGEAVPTWPSNSDITVSQTAARNAAKGRVSNMLLGNHLYLEQKIGSSNNSITIEQTGNFNRIEGLSGTPYAIIDGDNNTVNIKQGDTLGKNIIEFNIVGNVNNISIWQARNPTTGLQDGNESGGHYIGLNVNGSTNTLSLKQSNDGGTTSGHFAYIDVTGNGNNGTLKQLGNGEKTFFGVINGGTNVFDVTQQGNGSYLDLSLTGNGHSVSANQKDAGSHKATINLTNAGGAGAVTLIQQGATAQNINITQQCATLAGCSVSVTQGN